MMKNKKTRKITICTALAALILTLTLSLCACNKSSAKLAKLSPEEFFGVGSVSTIKLLGSSVGASAIKTMSEVTSETLPNNQSESSSATNGEKSEEAEQSQAEKFNKYFTALDSFLGQDVISVDTSANTDADFSQYATKLTVNGKDIAGNSVVYTLYYNEASSNSPFEEDDEDEDEINAYYVLNGVMVIDGENYQLSGARSTETEDDESEELLKIRAYSAQNEQNYVEMVQETSVEDGENEIEYVYRVYNNGVMVEETAVEFEHENENGKVETEFEVIFRNGTQVSRYSVEKIIDGTKTAIEVKYNVNGKIGKFVIEEINQNGETCYEYTFTDGTKQVMNVG